MAIARDFDCRGWTADQYDELMRRMNLGGRSAPGVLYHWAAATPAGIRAVDVYESREAADALAQGRIGPLAQELGLSMPQISEYEVHAILHP
jgi:hypothetical protein